MARAHADIWWTEPFANIPGNAAPDIENVPCRIVDSLPGGFHPAEVAPIAQQGWTAFAEFADDVEIRDKWPGGSLPTVWIRESCYLYNAVFATRGPTGRKRLYMRRYNYDWACKCRKDLGRWLTATITGTDGCPCIGTMTMRLEWRGRPLYYWDNRKALGACNGDIYLRFICDPTWSSDGFRLGAAFYTPLGAAAACANCPGLVGPQPGASYRPLSASWTILLGITCFGDCGGLICPLGPPANGVNVTITA